ncbi:MAG TPA: glycine oxidase ThiO [Gaiellaceae bacterium]|nr:glycine oxidase ThiO [Gaiellaceae bacterium]
MYDAVFVGGGVIGLACARRATERGLEVCVLERGAAGSGASRVAAGILAPDGEREPGDDPFVLLARRSLELYPEFVGALGADVGFWPCGMLTVTFDGDEAAALTSAECRALEPGLSPLVAGGTSSEHEASVDPRRLVAALAAGVNVREGVEVTAVTRGSVTTAAGETIPAGRVVVCAGAWSGFAGAPVRPVKGQVVRLRGELPARRMIRTERVYVVPRRNGEVVLGATLEERGFDTTVTAGAVRELLDEGCRVLPELRELELVDVTAGLRPGSPDDGPLLGEREDGVVLATGHYRNGILLAPVTAETIAALLAGEEPPPEAEPFAPGRASVGLAEPGDEAGGRRVDVQQA